jgi:phage/plasmid-like protein (TIGR03299 family)
MTETQTYADVDQAFSTRTVPWMKMGKLEDEPTTAAHAAKLGGIDFTVSEHPVAFMTKEDGKPPRYTKIDGRKAIVRNDTGDWLSIVSKAYPVLQYGEAFDFMDGVSPQFVAAGGLRGGRQAFMVVQVELPTDLTKLLDGEDPHEMYGVLRTSHDCSRAVEVMVMPLRGRCMNQLTLQSFRKDVKFRWVVTHTGDVKAKLAAAEDSIKRLDTYARTYVDNVERLNAVTVSDEAASDVLKRVLPDRPRRDEVITKIITGWHSRPEIGFEGTGWGLVNAVSEYFEWQRSGGTPESRFLAALQGQTHKAINKTAALVLSRN